MALSSITGVSNLQLWNLARKMSPHFKSHTSKGTADMFTEKGFEALKRSDLGAINEFFELSIRVAFQKLNVSRAKNIFENKGLVQVYDTPNGGYTQRMAIDSIKPVTPAFKNLENGDSVDPFLVRKPTMSERFFGQNFDYQSFITIQDFQVKTIFVSEYGMGEFIGGIMKGLENGYNIQKSINTKEALNAAINSTDYPLQNSQVVNITWDFTAEPTDAMLYGYLLGVKDVLTNMSIAEQTSAYNAGKFKTLVDQEDLVMVVRGGIKNRIELGLEVGAFNIDKLSLDIDEMIEVDNFGGLKPYVLTNTSNPDTAANRTYLQPIYDKNGEQVAYVDATATVNGYATFNGTKWVVNVTSGSTTADTSNTYVDDTLAGWEDPNADVLAIICQKGLVFENLQNPYELSPIYNPRGLYTNYWASSPNNAINVDPYYNMVVIRGVQS